MRLHASGKVATHTNWLKNKCASLNNNNDNNKKQQEISQLLANKNLKYMKHSARQRGESSAPSRSQYECEPIRYALGRRCNNGGESATTQP